MFNLLISPPGGTYVVTVDIVVGVLEVEIHVVRRVGRTVDSISAVHVGIVGRCSNVRRTRTLHQFGGGDIGHADLQCAGERGVAVLHEFLEAVAAGGPGIGAEDGAVGQVVVGRPVVVEYELHLTCRAVGERLCVADVSTPHLEHTLVAGFLTEHEQVVLNGVDRAVGQIAHLEDGTVGTGVEVDECVVGEGDHPRAIVTGVVLVLLAEEGGERTVVEGVLDDLEVLVEVGTGLVDTGNPAVTACSLVVVTAVVEQVVLDQHVVPDLVVRTLLADETADEALERAVLHDQRVEGNGHTVREHIEEVVTRSGTESGLVVTVVVTQRIIEVDIIECQLLHVDFAAFTSFR